MANDPVLGLPSESITAPDSFLAFTDDGRFLDRSSYTLLHRGSSMGKDKVLDIMHKLIGYQLANLPIMFEQATACEFLHLFPQTAHASYGISQDEGGIFFVPNEDTQNSLTQLVGGNNELVSIDASNGTVFYKIGDSTYGGWSLLSMNHTQHPRLVYPVDTSIYLDWDGLENLQCTSQLDANVANSWGGDKRNDWRLFDSRD
ncbi:uncharacterized protein KY384_003998 [Bacidia gigantensis]|uniref:uncharacterized protein n=1 Tax=Bacidia gigantensis TaxID=2732470 RepID=UPI001D055C62|nr:uncharacterized protein KY384_003998 [Bacidia gigantensis]KAG8531286.1 hypothetical protein KY384_003998 [Bacidia gigantensis]